MTQKKNGQKQEQKNRHSIRKNGRHRAACLLSVFAVLLSGCGRASGQAVQSLSGDGITFTQSTDVRESSASSETAESLQSDSQTESVGEDSQALSAEAVSSVSAEEDTAAASAEQPTELTDLEEKIQADLAAETAGSVRGAVYVENLRDSAYAWYDSRYPQNTENRKTEEGGETSAASASADSDRRMQAASLIKLFIAGAVWEQYDAVKARETSAGETDSLLSAMLSQSDNDASNTLTTRLGGGDGAAGRQAVNDYCSSHGYTDTHMGRMLLESNASDDNYTSVRDCSRILKNIWLSSSEKDADIAGETSSSSLQQEKETTAQQEDQETKESGEFRYETDMPGADQMLQALEQQARTGKIPAGVPSSVRTANKTGELDDVQNDAAIVFLTGNPYVISVMLEKVPAAGSAIQTITQVSADVYSYMQAQ